VVVTPRERQEQLVARQGEEQVDAETSTEQRAVGERRERPRRVVVIRLAEDVPGHTPSAATARSDSILAERSSPACSTTARSSSTGESPTACTPGTYWRKPPKLARIRASLRST
jgi:hypothetical protein